MKPLKLTADALRGMSAPERESLRTQLKAKKEELRAKLREVEDTLKLIREREEIPGYVTINEYLAAHHKELTAVEKSQLGDRLKKGVNNGKWESGQKTVATNNKSRCARFPTYDQNVIKGVLREMRTF